MSTLKEELKQKLEKIHHIFIYAYETYLYTEYLHHPATPDELNVVVNSAQSHDLRAIMHMMFRTLVTEVSKLFSNSSNDKFRLEAFVQSLASDGHFRKIGVNAQHVQNWQSEIDAHRATIENILLLRSKLYAHTDDPLISYNNIDVSFKNIKDLLDLASSVLQSIYHDIFQTELLIIPLRFERRKFDLLKFIAEGEKRRVDAIYDKYFPDRKKGQQ